MIAVPLMLVGFMTEKLDLRIKDFKQDTEVKGFVPFLRWNLLKYACNIEIILNTAVKEMLLGIKCK